MLGLKRVHHIAIIATDYARSKAFYCDILGFTLQSEFYRAERDSWKGDLAKRFVSIPLPVNALPSLAIRTTCRWKYISSKPCQRDPGPVTCRAITSRYVRGYDG